MPRVATFEERKACVKNLVSNDKKYVRAIKIPESFNKQLEGFDITYSDFKDLTYQMRTKLENLINDIIKESMKSNLKFDEFVDIKEVPYGRYN